MRFKAWFARKDKSEFTKYFTVEDLGEFDRLVIAYCKEKKVTLVAAWGGE